MGVEDSRVPFRNAYLPVLLALLAKRQRLRGCALGQPAQQGAATVEAEQAVKSAGPCHQWSAFPAAHPHPHLSPLAP